MRPLIDDERRSLLIADEAGRPEPKLPIPIPIANAAELRQKLRPAP